MQTNVQLDDEEEENIDEDKVIFDFKQRGCRIGACCGTRGAGTQCPGDKVYSEALDIAYNSPRNLKFAPNVPPQAN